MANAETTIMSGALEDDKGRRLLPETTAAQVIHTDGESSETKFKRQAGSANMSATLAASAAKTVVDLSAYIRIGQRRPIGWKSWHLRQTASLRLLP